MAFVWGVARHLVLLLAISSLFSCSQSDSSREQPGPGGFDTSRGNGNFGSWINDEFGLPAFRYSGCSTDSCEEPADVFHQLGNDDISAIAHGDGYVELFTAKTFYRVANKYDESARNYAGGFGWIRDGEKVWSTLYDDRPAGSSYERIFGMGYFKKTVEHDGLKVEHYIYSAPGGDEALLSHIVFTNTGDRMRTFRYFDYWDVAWWLVASTHPVVQVSDFDPSTVRTLVDRERASLKVVSESTEGDPEVPSLFEDPSPKTSFVAILDGSIEGYETVQDSFLGSGTRAVPEQVADGALRGGLRELGGLRNENSVMVTEREISLGPGQSDTLDTVFGLARRGAADALVDRYRSADAYRLPSIAADWARRIPRLELPQDEWIEREMAWSYYYLLSGMLLEEFFDARVINQGSIYQWTWGANAGPRASLRHLLPLIYTDPDRAREMVGYHLRATASSGRQSYATAGYGAWQPFGFEPSDSGLWLLWSAAEYVYGTRDFDFLDAELDYYCETRRGGCGSATVYEMLATVFRYQRDVISLGEHGLIRLLNSDWDDFLTAGSSGVDAVITDELGESTLNTALALVAYPKLADLAESRGDVGFASEVRREVEGLSSAIRAQWRGEFLNRAYVYTAEGAPIEIGSDNLWLAQNGVALLAEGVLDREERERLVGRMRTDLERPSSLGLASQGEPITANVGVAGFWYSLAGPAIEGLMIQPFSAARDLAWDAFRQQTLANHAEVAPDIWYGVWSGPDMYFTDLEAAAVDSPIGSTWCFPNVLCMQDFPVTNMFSHSEPLLSSIRLAGVSTSQRGIRIDPGFPFDDFTWESSVFAVRYTPTKASGKLLTVGADSYEVRVRLPRELGRDSVTVRVNGRPVDVEVVGDMAVFEMSGGTWEVGPDR